MEQYRNLTDAINDLRKKGYTLDFSVNTNFVECMQNGKKLSPKEFGIDEAFRFEEDSDPENQSVLYAISSIHGEKGLLVNAYGIYADEISNDLVDKLKINHIEIK